MLALLSSNPEDPELADVRRILVIVLAVGSILFGYGVAAHLGMLPGSGFVVGAFVYIATAIGALLVSLMGTAAVWLWHQDQREPLTARQIAIITAIAPVIAVVAMSFFWEWSTTSLSYNVRFLTWTFLGQTVLSLQFLVGSVRPVRRRRLIMVTEVVAVAVFVIVFFIVTPQRANSETLVFFSVGAVTLFLLFGAPLYRLGSRFFEGPR